MQFGACETLVKLVISFAVTNRRVTTARRVLDTQMISTEQQCYPTTTLQSYRYPPLSLLLVHSPILLHANETLPALAVRPFVWCYLRGGECGR